MSFVLDDEGFIDVLWSAPLEVLNTEVEDSNLLSFSEVRAIFEKIIFISTESNIPEGYNLVCNVTKVRLELMRVIKQNSNLEGFLIPVWNFYGINITYDENGDPPEHTKYMESILLSVNAIDGSIIDGSKGY